MTQTLQVALWRGSAEGRYQSYQVPIRDNQTVLDVVTWVQRNVDATLSYRFACRVGMCGSCAMTVNGRPDGPAARTSPRSHRKASWTIAPLSNLPVIKDLATDMSDVFRPMGSGQGPVQGHGDARTTLIPAGRSPHRPSARRRMPASNASGAASATPRATGRWRPEFLGPAALNRAWTLVNDVRDAGNGDRLRPVAAGAGCHACHSHGSCPERSPQSAHPDRLDRRPQAQHPAGLHAGEIKP